MDCGDADVVEAGQVLAADNSDSRKRPRVSRDTARKLDERDQVPQYLPKVKSCVECRQQKIKCNVVKEPFTACSNCTRLKKHCEIDQQYKRIPRRDQIVALKDQVRELHQQLKRQSAQAASSGLGHGTTNISKELSSPSLVAGQTLDKVSLSGEELDFLFEQFFKFYHPFCPLLDPELGSRHYFSLSPVLGWTVVIIAARRYPPDPELVTRLSAPYHKLLWTTIQEMPQRYHTAKALALLCTWPLVKVYAPYTAGSEYKAGAGLGLSEVDPSFMLSGIMIQIALQTGIHRPLHAQDFIRPMRFVSQEEVNDRRLTWIVCNIVAQSVTTTSGQPSRLEYNWGSGAGVPAWYSVPAVIDHRGRVENFCTKVTQSLYNNFSDLPGLITEEQLPVALNALIIDIQELDALSSSFSLFNKLCLLAAKIHFYAFAFYLPDTFPTRPRYLSAVYKAAISFTEAVIEYDTHSNRLLEYCTSFILRTLISASCVLLKILNSDFAINFDITQGRTSFNMCVLAIRSASVKSNDFPERVAQAQTRMWLAAGGGFDAQTNRLREEPRHKTDPLALRVRSLMCVSHVFDCIWGWRRTIGPHPQVAPVDDHINTTPFANNIFGATTEIFPQQDTLSSSIDDFDLFNSLDWAAEDQFIWPSALERISDDV